MEVVTTPAMIIGVEVVPPQVAEVRKMKVANAEREQQRHRGTLIAPLRERSQTPHRPAVEQAELESRPSGPYPDERVADRAVGDRGAFRAAFVSAGRRVSLYQVRQRGHVVCCATARAGMGRDASSGRSPRPGAKKGLRRGRGTRRRYGFFPGTCEAEQRGGEHLVARKLRPPLLLENCSAVKLRNFGTAPWTWTSSSTPEPRRRR
jgi:hypothetical protein